LTASFTTAYGDTLKKHHNMLVKGVFSLAMKACPYRADFYKKLGNDENKVKVDLEEWLTALEMQLNILNKFLEGVKW
jgi:Glycolipid transfer protein (GLTP)